MKKINLIVSVLFLLSIFSAVAFATNPDTVPTVAPSEIPTYAPTTVPTQAPTLTESQSSIAFPNPVNIKGDITLKYNPKAGKVVEKSEAAIYAVNGDKVLSVAENINRNGFIKFNVANLAPGVYIYRITTTYTDGSKESFKVKKFAVVKSGAK